MVIEKFDCDSTDTPVRAQPTPHRCYFFSIWFQCKFPARRCNQSLPLSNVLHNCRFYWNSLSLLLCEVACGASDDLINSKRYGTVWIKRLLNLNCQQARRPAHLWPGLVLRKLNGLSVEGSPPASSNPTPSYLGSWRWPWSPEPECPFSSLSFQPTSPVKLITTHFSLSHDTLNHTTSISPSTPCTSSLTAYANRQLPSAATASLDSATASGPRLHTTSVPAFLANGLNTRSRLLLSSTSLTRNYCALPLPRSSHRPR